ncbi:uncharacterized protein LOC114245333 isoform X2 [Bombyx mandarina]|uniref:Uncharacterized protein n=2 Tax=Bombyx TaxID=7090 RepID=A0A8R2AU66_BOMMO|nr:uncharacterized protein LOC101739083 isoform X2 [Bombyx mori]XP_028033272.1 uncharacterized protein LOC114245333 isoform X2 [Bombyx mandarina]
MPANTIESCLQGARYNFDAVRPAPICGDANQPGQCHNVHISTNFYYGFHEVKTSGINHMATDCEMQEVPIEKNVNTLVTTARKRSADNSGYPQSKRFREEVMVPTTTNSNPCLLRPTHNNPDISRCLMVHMI